MVALIPPHPLPATSGERWRAQRAGEGLLPLPSLLAHSAPTAPTTTPARAPASRRPWVERPPFPRTSPCDRSTPKAPPSTPPTAIFRRTRLPPAAQPRTPITPTCARTTAPIPAPTTTARIAHRKNRRIPPPPPHLPDHVDTTRLLFDYFESINLLDLANLYDVDLEDLVTWSEHPHIIKQLARLRAANARRAEDIRAHSAAAAAAALYHIVRNPKYMSEHISIPAELRHMEIVVKAALAILTPLERTKTFLRALRLRRKHVPLTGSAVSASSPRAPRTTTTNGAGFPPAEARVPQASRLCAPQSPRAAPAPSPGAQASSPRRRKEPKRPPSAPSASKPAARAQVPCPDRSERSEQARGQSAPQASAPAKRAKTPSASSQRIAPGAAPRPLAALPQSQQRTAGPRDLIAGAGALPRAP